MTAPGPVATLLAGLIDYAGLFPPAALPMRDAVARYAEHRRGAERAMLGRFVVPAARLAELTTEVDRLPFGAPTPAARAPSRAVRGRDAGATPHRP